MKKIITAICITLAGALTLPAQQNVGPSASKTKIASPVVNDNHTVTFLLDAPKAKKVTVIGDWCDDRAGAEMKKGKDGVWTLTSGELPSEMYTYRYVVDGMTIIDPSRAATWAISSQYSSSTTVVPITIRCMMCPTALSLKTGIIPTLLA